VDCVVAVCTDDALSEVTIVEGCVGKVITKPPLVRQQAIQNRILKSEYVMSVCSCGVRCGVQTRTFYRTFQKKFVQNAAACCRHTAVQTVVLVVQREKVVQVLENCRTNLAERLNSRSTMTCTGFGT
jgi:hypothetical protein